MFVISEEANITENELSAFKEKLKDGSYCSSFILSVLLFLIHQFTDLEPVNQTETSSPKIIFRKPTKDKDSKQGMLAVQSSSKKTDKTDESSKLHDKRNQIKSVKNSSLLSFNEDDEES